MYKNIYIYIYIYIFRLSHRHRWGAAVFWAMEVGGWVGRGGALRGTKALACRGEVEEVQEEEEVVVEVLQEVGCRGGS
jgi:hypothetical protein